MGKFSTKINKKNKKWVIYWIVTIYNRTYIREKKGENMSEKERKEKEKRILEVLTKHAEDIPDVIIDILYGMLCG